MDSTNGVQINGIPGAPPMGGAVPPLPGLSPRKPPSETEITTKAVPLKNYRDIPVTVLNDWDNVQFVRSALFSMEQGTNFRDAAYLSEAFGRDDRISACTSTRLNGLLGSKLEFEIQSEQEDDEVSKDLRAEVLAAFQVDWDNITTSASLRQILQWGLFLGIGLGELIWNTDGDRWVPTIKVWHPSFLYWRWDTRSFWLITMDGTVEIPESGLDPMGRPKWVVFCPYGYYRGWMNGYVRGLAIPFLMRSWGRRDLGRYSEIHGVPIRKGVVPSSAPESVKADFEQNLSNIGSEAVILCEKSKDGEQFDVEMVEPKSTNWEIFLKELEHCDTSIAVILLGQNLTTEVQGGSHAAAKVQDRVRGDYKKADADALSTCVRDHVGRPWAKFNYGDEDLAPKPTWQVDPPEDAAEKGRAIQAIGAGVLSLQQAGADVDITDLLQQLGIPTLDEDQIAERRARQAELAAAAPAVAPAGKAPAAPVEPSPEPRGVELSERKTKDRTRVAVIAALNPRGQMLWGTRNDNGLWTTPAGHLELGEVPSEAAHRELFEEAGLKTTELKFLGRGLGGAGDVEVYCYEARVDGDPSSDNDPDQEVSHWGWYDPHELPPTIKRNLHVQDNILLKLMGLQAGAVEKFREERAP